MIYKNTIVVLSGTGIYIKSRIFAALRIPPPLRSGGVIEEECMSYIPPEELLPRSGFSVYKLIRMAANRAMELADGKPKLVEKVSTDKVATIALEEIRAGKVELKAIAEARGRAKKGEGKDKASETPKEISV